MSTFSILIKTSEVDFPSYAGNSDTHNKFVLQDAAWCSIYPFLVKVLNQNYNLSDTMNDCLNTTWDKVISENIDKILPTSNFEDIDIIISVLARYMR